MFVFVDGCCCVKLLELADIALLLGAESVDGTGGGDEFCDLEIDEEEFADAASVEVETLLAAVDGDARTSVEVWRLLAEFNAEAEKVPSAGTGLVVTGVAKPVALTGSLLQVSKNSSSARDDCQ